MNKNNKHIIDHSIIQGCKDNNNFAQRELYQRSIARLYNVVYRIIYDKQETEDILQESFIKIFANISTYDKSKGQIMTWMNRICINQAINHLRKRNRLKFDNIDTQYHLAAPISMDLLKIDTVYIYNAINQLSKTYRIIFNLYEIEGYTHQEISEMLNININSCRVYLTRAKTKLQTILRRSANDNSNIKAKNYKV